MSEQGHIAGVGDMIKRIQGDDTRSSSSSRTWEYPVNQQVVVHGLCSTKGQKLNGQTGRVIEATGSEDSTLDRMTGRYTVKLDLGEVVRVKQGNLRQPTAEDYHRSANLAMNGATSLTPRSLATPQRAAAEALARKAHIQGQQSCVVPGQPNQELLEKMSASAAQACVTDPTYYGGYAMRARVLDGRGDLQGATVDYELAYDLALGEGKLEESENLFMLPSLFQQCRLQVANSLPTF
eukprot:SAG31_NODE_1606_length_7761_cov_4.493996_5_plen_237_part_00